MGTRTTSLISSHTFFGQILRSGGLPLAGAQEPARGQGAHLYRRGRGIAEADSTSTDAIKDGEISIRHGYQGFAQLR